MSGVALVVSATQETGPPTPADRSSGGTSATAPRAAQATAPSFATQSAQSATTFLEPCLRRRVGGSWGTTLSFCAQSGRGARSARRGPNRRVPSPEAVARVLADHARELAPDPRTELAPSDVGVTGLRAYAWTHPASPIVATVVVGGARVTAEARPVAYRWDWGDGHRRTTRTAGRPWTSARGGSIGHVFDTKGLHEITLTLTWEARWRVGRGAWTTLGTFSTGGSRPYVVREVVALLVPGR